jgi:glycosyltransferase involved in cell wall biosynthesis
MPLIQQAAFVVCPYLEASQSGVLMTALALQKCVLATRVGAFPEYIQDGQNGYLCEPNEEDVERKMNEIISHRSYEIIEHNLKNIDSAQQEKEHFEKLWRIWSA